MIYIYIYIGSLGHPPCVGAADRKTSSLHKTRKIHETEAVKGVLQEPDGRTTEGSRDFTLIVRLTRKVGANGKWKSGETELAWLRAMCRSERKEGINIKQRDDFRLRKGGYSTDSDKSEIGSDRAEEEELALAEASLEADVQWKWH